MMKDRHRPVKNLILALVVFFPGVTFFSVATGNSVYRWVSPSGVVTYGDHPVPGARQIRKIPDLPVGPAVSVPPSLAVSPAPKTRAREGRSNAALHRLLLLMAIQQMEENRQYQNTHHHHDYLYPGYGYFPERHFPYGRPYGFHSRGGRRPDRFQGYGYPQPGPPRVLLPPQAPSSAYSNPVIIPQQRP